MKLRVVFFALALAACASSRRSGDVDGATADATDDGDVTPIDAPAATDGPQAIDAPATPIDATVDATVDANTCTTQPCDLHSQCGCTPPLTCDIDFTDLMGTACRAVNVPGTQTSLCSSFSECAASHVCVGGRCQRYCDADNDCGQPRGACAIQLTDQNDLAIPGATTCSSSCDPTNSAAGGCPTGQKCGFFEGIGGRDIVDCTTPGAGAIGATCTTDATCASNTYCTTLSAQTRCRKICQVGSAQCGGSVQCIGFTTPLVVGGTTYGICP